MPPSEVCKRSVLNQATYSTIASSRRRRSRLGWRLDWRLDSMEASGPFRLDSRELGGLPIVCHFLERAGLGALLERYLPACDARLRLSPAEAIGVVVRNLCLGREPVYGLGAWARRFEPGLLGLGGERLGALNDDRVGRALACLFDADHASLLTELVLAVVAEFELDLQQLHNDSTSITFSGAYAQADGRPRGGKPPPAITFGHNKDHRPDLKQLLWVLTVCADEAVPIAYRSAAGNTTDDQTHIASWGRPGRALRARRLPLRRRLQAVHARDDGPHQRARRTLPLRAAAQPQGGRLLPRLGTEPQPGLGRGSAAAAAAAGRPRPGVARLPGTASLRRGLPGRLGARKRQAGPRRRGAPDAYREGRRALAALHAQRDDRRALPPGAPR